ncbi:MAG: urea ABC transporter substrate-binding protein [Mariprofundus sp.]
MKLVLSMAIIAIIVLITLLFPVHENPPIRVGILHSLTGTMASSEKPVVDATLLAIDQINRSGGLLGRKIEAVVADGKSDGPSFAREAERLIVNEHVSVIFGCWTSASRKHVKAVVEKYNNLLFYPVQYEGLEHSANIFYTGATPNQQIIPAVYWAIQHLGKRIYLIGSDYVFPRVANWLIRKQVKALGGTIVGERYLLLGDTDVHATVAEIAALHPDVVLNTINGDTNTAFFQALNSAGLDANAQPVLSFSMGESEIANMNNNQLMTGYYVAADYFQSIDNDENRLFVRAFQQKYGDTKVVSAPMEAAWVGTQLWANAVTAAGTDRAEVIRDMLHHQSLRAPEGIIAIDHDSQHTWKTARIGRLLANGQLAIRWTSEAHIAPEPFPAYVSKRAAVQFLDALQQGWHGEWAAPTRKAVKQP